MAPRSATAALPVNRLLSVWLPALRPRTLPAAVAPVLMGTGLAARDGAFHAWAAAGALLGALLLQIGTNFANDYYDFVKGADGDDRLGPARATQSGWVRPEDMRRAFLWVFALAALVGAGLIARGGWPIAVIGIASLACGYLYTGGPRPLGYLGLGDLMVLVFFGPVAVAGTHYVQTLLWSPTAAVIGLGPGLLATALLAVNNLRDTESDARAGKRTLAVRFGREFAKREFATALLGAAAVPVVAWLALRGPAAGLSATAACLLAIPALRRVRRAAPGDRLLEPLASTGRVLGLYGVLFTAACLLAR